MRDSNVASATKESAQADFSHSLQYLRPRLKTNGERIEADSEDGPAHPVPQRRRTGPGHLNF